jgi:hypothetical protein
MNDADGPGGGRRNAVSPNGTADRNESAGLKETRDRIEEANDKPSQGPSLTLLYSLIVLALVVAIILACLIVLPFYHRR